MHRVRRSRWLTWNSLLWKIGLPRTNSYLQGWPTYQPRRRTASEWGISTQRPSALTCVTTGFPRKFRSASVYIIYRHIANKLYWGFEHKRTRHGSHRIAGPEKALLDWLYLQRQEGLATRLTN